MDVRTFDDMSEDEDAVRKGEPKEKTHQEQPQEAANTTMQCKQSLQDTEGLEIFSEHDKQRTNLFRYSDVEEDRLLSCCTTPSWYRGDVPSHCSRGCCGLPWTSAPSRGGLIGPEYVEDESLPGTRHAADMYNGGGGFSKGLPSSSAVHSMLVSALKQRSSCSGNNILSIIQELVARELNEQTPTLDHPCC